MAPLDRFDPATAAWFRAAFDQPTPAQALGWEAIASGQDTLIHAPTGSGKTLAAFLWSIDRLLTEPTAAPLERCRVLYISPLKALAYDVERNLRAPLRGIVREAGLTGRQLPEVSVAMRTGDTPAQERRSMMRTPPDILITTPESLYLLLTSQARQILTSVETVIIDEIHAIAGSKRGTHLALSLERLRDVTKRPPVRIGLSATQRPLETIADFLGGGVPSEQGWAPRPVSIVDAPRDRTLEIEIVVPVDDMTKPETTDAAGRPSRSVWPSIYPQIIELVNAHRSTIVFANSRGLVERLAAALNEHSNEEIARAHHGSVSRDQRVEIESGLKDGTLRCVVATSSLELGIDMDAVDLVVLVESPTTVARGLQRVGRAGHQVGAPSQAKVYPKHRGDLLEATVIVDRMYEGQIEATHVPQNPLDVLAQQIVATVAVADQDVDDLYEFVRRASPYRTLAREPFEAVLDMLSGRYPSDDFAELRPRITWDRVAGTLTARSNARMLAVTNAGTIPDRGLYTVNLPGGGRVGELDEEMVYESRVGDVFVLGSSTWQITEITPDRVTVVPAPGRPAAKMPFWHGDTLGRPVETGRAIGAFTREIGVLEPTEATSLLTQRYRLDTKAAANLVRYLAEEQVATGTLPTDRTLVAQRFRDELGDWRVVLLSPFGARVHAPWSMAAAAVLRRDHGIEVDAVWSDDGFILRFPDADAAPDPSELILDPIEASALIVDEAGGSALFASRFREAASRSLLLPRRRPGNRTPLWLQRRKSTSLLQAAGRYPTFPVVLEAMREVLQEHFDVAALVELLGDIAARRIRLVSVDTTGPSPFASSLMFDFVASFMYEYDAPAAERRAMALTIDRDLLSQLLGEPALRELLDPQVIAAVELELQRLADGTGIHGLDGITDLLRSIGPLPAAGIAARSADPITEELLTDLEAQRRIVSVLIGGEPHWAAIEDVARLRDGIGVPPPRGVPEALLEPVEDPLGDIVGRFARTHGPFTTQIAAGSLGLPPAVVDATLRTLETRGKVVSGAFHPGGVGTEWVDTGVLRRLQRRSLAALRGQVEAVDAAALGSFLPAWHGVGETGSTPGRLLDVIDRLQGAALPASILERDVLACRLGYSPDLLDAALATGEIVWIGRGPLAGNDGRIALYRRHQVPLLAWSLDLDHPDDPVHDQLRDHLGQRGASFFPDLYQAVGGGDVTAVVDAIWDLVWAGEITNDTIAPLRAFLRGAKSRRGQAARPRMPTSATPAAVSGRWSLTLDLQQATTPTEQLAARAAQLLERHGVVVREAVLSESVPGGFAGLYPVYSALEEAGRVRRGYFVDGLGGAQFALPGAVDRLRSTETASVVLAAADPANPYGAAVTWPESAGRPTRRAGAYVVLEDGLPTVFVERGGRSLVTFATSAAESGRTARAVADMGRRHIGRITIERIDGDSVAESPLAAALLEAGFVQGYKGLTLRP
jgi:ATP-dependent helicase Lhr and Lhr-like helicase